VFFEHGLTQRVGAWCLEQVADEAVGVTGGLDHGTDAGPLLVLRQQLDSQAAAGVSDQAIWLIRWPSGVNFRRVGDVVTGATVTAPRFFCRSLLPPCGR